MDDHALLECGTDGTVQAILKVELAVIFHDVSEEVAVEGRVIGEKGIEVKRALCCGDLGEA